MVIKSSLCHWQLQAQRQFTYKWREGYDQLHFDITVAKSFRRLQRNNSVCDCVMSLGSKT